MHTLSQTEVILNHLKKYGKITSLEAFGEYQILRLSARIHDLRDLGYNITTESKTKNGKTFAIYHLDQGVKDAKENI